MRNIWGIYQTILIARIPPTIRTARAAHTIQTASPIHMVDTVVPTARTRRRIRMQRMLQGFTTETEIIGGV